MTNSTSSSNQKPPAWLFTNNQPNSHTPQTSEAASGASTMVKKDKKAAKAGSGVSTMAKKDKKAAKTASAGAVAPMGSSDGGLPPAQLMDLVENFLSDQGFEHAHLEFQKHRAKKGWKSADGKNKEAKKEHHSLVNVFQTWETFSSKDSTPLATVVREVAEVTKVSSSSSDSDSSSDSSSDSDSDSDAPGDVNMADAPAAAESSSESSSSSSDSSSDSSDSDSDGDAAAANVTSGNAASGNAAANPLKRKASSDSDSSSDSSDSDDDMSDSSSSSEDKKPKVKKVKTVASSDDESSSSSDSDSDSDDSESDDEDKTKTQTKTAKTVSSESDSSDDSSSDDTDSEVEAAANVPLPESDSSSDSSSSDSDSDSDSATQPAKAKKEGKGVSKNGAGSDTSATLEKTSPEFFPVSAFAPLPPQPKLDNKTSNRGNGNGGKRPQNEPFSRIKKDVSVDPRLSSNAYIEDGYGLKAHEDLIITRGKGFTKEKNKKKRGAYKGGPLDVQVSRSFKFED